MIDTANIDTGKLQKELFRYENQWVALSAENRIVASGRTYGETVEQVPEPEEVVLLKVPPADASLAPSGA